MLKIIKWFRHCVRKLVQENEVFNSINDLESRACTSFVHVVKNFFGNYFVKTYKDEVEKLLKSLLDIGANMSIKLQFLHCYQDKFLDN